MSKPYYAGKDYQEIVDEVSRRCMDALLTNGGTGLKAEIFQALWSYEQAREWDRAHERRKTN